MYKKLIGKNIGYGANEQNSLAADYHPCISPKSLSVIFSKNISFAIIPTHYTEISKAAGWPPVSWIRKGYR